MLRGIDISKWQNTSAVDLAADFVIMKATEGVGYVDPTCDIKYQYAKSKGKLLGVYAFARPDLGGAIADADYFVDNTAGYWQPKEAVLVLDWESGNTRDVNWALTWLRRVRDRTGVKPLIYMSASVVASANWQAVVNEDFGLWIAGYPNKYNVTNPPTPAEGEMPYDTGAWGFAAIWQYTSSAGTLDRDVAYMSREAWGKYAGQGNAPAPQPPQPVITTKDETTETAIPFETVRHEDASQPKDWEVQVQSGTDGKHVVVTRITYTDGNETSREVVSDTTIPPVEEIVYYGTKEEEPTPPPAGNPGEPTIPSDGNSDGDNGSEVPPSKPDEPAEGDKPLLEVIKQFILDQLTKLWDKKDEIVAWLKSIYNKRK